MKIEINPKTLQDFNELNLPATVTFSKSNIVFNNVAKKKLSIAKDSCFQLEIIDGNLYYKDSATGGFKITQETPKMLTLAASGIGALLDSHLHCGTKTNKFLVGEFKEGKRLLTLMK